MGGIPTTKTCGSLNVDKMAAKIKLSQAAWANACVSVHQGAEIV